MAGSDGARLREGHLHRLRAGTVRAAAITLLTVLLCTLPRSAQSFERSGAPVATGAPFVLAPPSSSAAPGDTASTTADSSGVRSDSSEALHRVLLKTLRGILPDTLAGVATDSLPRRLQRSLKSLAFDTLSVDTASGLHNRLFEGVHFVYRQIYIGIAAATNLGATTLGDPDRIIRFRDYFRERGRTFGWHPLLEATSGPRIQGGLRFFYHDSRFGASLSGAITERKKWSNQLRVTVRDTVRGDVWQASLLLLKQQDDDMYFYGIGRDPATDSRTPWRAGEAGRRGLFYQEQTKVQIIAGVRPASNTEIVYTGFFRRRGITWPGGSDGLGGVFDASRLPGALGRRKKIYSELAVHHDTRAFRGLVTPGVGLEGYAGVDVGVEGDASRLLRYGGDVAGYLPVLGPGRLLVPRLVANMVLNLNASVPIAFYDYPRHPTFRGVSPRWLLRSDNFVFVPSLEVRQRIAPRFTLGVFSDYLTVAPDVRGIQPNVGVWTAGAEIVFHDRFQPLASFQAAYGPEGLRVLLSLGGALNLNERSQW